MSHRYVTFIVAGHIWSAHDSVCVNLAGKVLLPFWLQRRGCFIRLHGDWPRRI